MKKTNIDVAHGVATPRPTKVPEIQAAGDYKIRIAAIFVVVILATGGILFSLCYPANLATIWAVITPLIMTILALTMRNSSKEGDGTK